MMIYGLKVNKTLSHGFKYRPTPIRVSNIVSDFEVTDTITNIAHTDA